MTAWGCPGAANDDWVRRSGPFAIDCRVCGYRIGEIDPTYDGSGSLRGVSYFIDVQMVERPGRHAETGLPRYGPPSRQFNEHRGPRGRQRSPRHTWPTLAAQLQPRDRSAAQHQVLDTPIFGYCPECNAGQVIEMPTEA